MRSIAAAAEEGGLWTAVHVRLDKRNSWELPGAHPKGALFCSSSNCLAEPEHGLVNVAIFETRFHGAAQNTIEYSLPDPSRPGTAALHSTHSS